MKPYYQLSNGMVYKMSKEAIHYFWAGRYHWIPSCTNEPFEQSNNITAKEARRLKPKAFRQKTP